MSFGKIQNCLNIPMKDRPLGMVLELHKIQESRTDVPQVPNHDILFSDQIQKVKLAQMK